MKFIVASIVFTFLVFAAVISGRTPPSEFEMNFSASNEDSLKPWKFLVLADVHSAERYLQFWKKVRLTTSKERQKLAKKQTDNYTQIKQTLGGELVLMPGDLANGEWHTNELASIFMPGAKKKDRLAAAANTVYSGLRKEFSDAGYRNILVAVGDHEIGDNPWSVFSMKYRKKYPLIPKWRKAFAKAFTDLTRKRYMIRNGSFSSPTGTPFEGTSHAVRHNNAVFVMVDDFAYSDKLLSKNEKQKAFWRRLGMGTPIIGAVNDNHLVWLESVLIEAREDTTIKYIFVSGHLPVLSPVRGRNSSMMLIENDEESEFWKLLRKYEVDVYFAGEVHANTVTKDAESNLLQVASRGGTDRSMVVSVDVLDDKLVIRHFAKDPQLREIGKLSADQISNAVESSGTLKVINRDAPMISLEFDSAVKSKNQFPNTGEFGERYGIDCERCSLSGGVVGNSLDVSGAGAKVPDGYIPPIAINGRPTTLALWFKTDRISKKQFVAGTLGQVSSATLGLIIRPNGVGILSRNMLFETKSPALIADGKWHHLVLVHKNGGRLRDIELFLDGERQEAHVTKGKDATVNLGWGHSLVIGSVPKFVDKKSWEPFLGNVDQLKVWARAITHDEILEDFSAGSRQRYE